MGIIAWIILGGLAGWIASKIAGTDEQQGWVANIIIGMVALFRQGPMAVIPDYIARMHGEA